MAHHIYEFVNRIELIDNIAGGNGIRRRNKVYKHRIDPFEVFDDEAFRCKYRFSKQTMTFIIELVKDELDRYYVTDKGGRINAKLQVLTAIRCWARGEIQCDSSDLHGISQPSVSIICQRVAKALAKRSQQFIKMPRTNAERTSTMQGFFNICGFRNVIGAIDCTHIRIPKQGGEMAQYFINRKGYSSLNIQVVCDSKLRINNIVAHWRGSTHDARIFNECTLKQQFERVEHVGILLGDSGYPCLPFLFTPVLNPRSEKENIYNEKQIKTRNTIERCFGLWKQRFRCLLKGFNTNLSNIKMTIVALAVLHNIAIQFRDNDEDNYNPLDDENLAVAGIMEIGNNPRGNAARSAFIEENF